MTTEKSKESRVDSIIGIFQNNKYSSTLILIGIIIISFSKVVDSGDSIARKLGLIKTYNVDASTNRGQFSSQLVKNGWNRMYWIRSYTERIRLKAKEEDLEKAWDKYMDATEVWSSNIMNYYLGLEEYYPDNSKRVQLQYDIQPLFIKVHKIMVTLRYKSDSLSNEEIVNNINSAQKIVDDINPKFCLLVDQPLK